MKILKLVFSLTKSGKKISELDIKKEMFCFVW